MNRTAQMTLLALTVRSTQEVTDFVRSLSGDDLFRALDGHPAPFEKKVAAIIMRALQDFEKGIKG